MKSMVIGGAGFIGTNLANRLSWLQHDVLVYDNYSRGGPQGLDASIATVNGDILAEKQLEYCIKNFLPDNIFHCAAQVSVNDSFEAPIEDATINILGTINVGRAVQRFGIERLFYFSSGGALYTNGLGFSPGFPSTERDEVEPTSPYGISKFAGEQYLQVLAKDTKLAILRLANVYGPYQRTQLGEGGVVAKFIERMIDGEPIRIDGTGTQTRDFIYVDDVVDACCKIIAHPSSGTYDTYNVGTGLEYSILSLFEMCAEELRYNKAPLFLVGQPFGKKRSSLSWKRIKEEVNWYPRTSLREGIRKTINWRMGPHA